MQQLSFIFYFCVPALSLIAGIFILRLKEWARKLVIFVRTASVIITVITWIPAFKSLQSGEFKASIEKSIEARKERIKTVYKPEYQEKLLERQDRNLTVADKAGSMFYLMFLWTIGWNAIIIYFFTRPQVKEQFASPQVLT